MKFTTILFALGASTAASAVFLRIAEPGNTCQDATTYNLCFDNVMSTTCGATDAPCNCKQSRLLMDCLGFCKDDPVLSSFGNAQQGETQRWCNTAASATPGVASPTPSTSGGVAPTAGTTSTNPTAPAGTSTTPTNKPNSAGKVTLASGLVALTGLVALLI